MTKLWRDLMHMDEWDLTIIFSWVLTVRKSWTNFSFMNFISRFSPNIKEILEVYESVYLVYTICLITRGGWLKPKDTWKINWIVHKRGALVSTSCWLLFYLHTEFDTSWILTVCFISSLSFHRIALIKLETYPYVQWYATYDFWRLIDGYKHL